MLLTGIFLLALLSQSKGFRLSTNSKDFMHEAKSNTKTDDVVDPVKNSLSAMAKPNIPDCPGRITRCPPVKDGCAWETYSIDQYGELCRDCDAESCSEPSGINKNNHGGSVSAPGVGNWVPIDIGVGSDGRVLETFMSGESVVNHRKFFHRKHITFNNIPNQQAKRPGHHAEQGGLGNRDGDDAFGRQTFTTPSASTFAAHASEVAPNIKRVPLTTPLTTTKASVSDAQIKSLLQSMKQMHEHLESLRSPQTTPQTRPNVKPEIRKATSHINFNKEIQGTRAMTDILGDHGSLKAQRENKFQRTNLNKHFSTFSSRQVSTNNHNNKGADNHPNIWMSDTTNASNVGKEHVLLNNQVDDTVNSNKWYFTNRKRQSNQVSNDDVKHAQGIPTETTTPQTEGFDQNNVIPNTQEPVWIDLDKNSHEPFSRPYPAQASREAFNGRHHLSLIWNESNKSEPVNHLQKQHVSDNSFTNGKYEESFHSKPRSYDKARVKSDTKLQDKHGGNEYKKVSYTDRVTGRRKTAYINLTRVKKFTKMLSYIRSKSPRAYKKARDSLKRRYKYFYQFHEPEEASRITRRSVGLSEELPAFDIWEVLEEQVDDLLPYDSFEIDSSEVSGTSHEELLHDSREIFGMDDSDSNSYEFRGFPRFTYEMKSEDSDKRDNFVGLSESDSSSYESGSLSGDVKFKLLDDKRRKRSLNLKENTNQLFTKSIDSDEIYGVNSKQSKHDDHFKNKFVQMKVMDASGEDNSFSDEYFHARLKNGHESEQEFLENFFSVSSSENESKNDDSSIEFDISNFINFRKEKEKKERKNSHPDDVSNESFRRKHKLVNTSQEDSKSKASQSKFGNSELVESIEYV